MASPPHRGRKLTNSGPSVKARRARGVDWRPAFLAALGVHGHVTDACRGAGVSRQAVYVARRAEPGFAAAWEEALEVVADGFKREAHRRAVEGVRTLMTYRGDPVFVWTMPDGSVVPSERAGAVLAPLYEYRYSDALLTTLLKAARPAEFRDHYHVPHAGNPAAPVRLAGGLSPAELQALDDADLRHQFAELEGRVDPT